MSREHEAHLMERVTMEGAGYEEGRTICRSRFQIRWWKLKSFKESNVAWKLWSSMKATMLEFPYSFCQGCGRSEWRREMGSKNSPNSVSLLWQIGSRTVKREKRPPRLIERRKGRHAGFESVLGWGQYVLAIHRLHKIGTPLILDLTAPNKPRWS